MCNINCTCILVLTTLKMATEWSKHVGGYYVV